MTRGWLADPERREQTGRRARSRALREHDWRRRARSILDRIDAMGERSGADQPLRSLSHPLADRSQVAPGDGSPDRAPVCGASI